MRRPTTRFIFATLAVALVAGSPDWRPAHAHEMEMHGWTATNAQASDKIYWLHGRINDANEQNGLVNITHDPVKELSWPSMTMTFHVSDKALFARMHPRDSIDFALREIGGNRYEIVDVKEHK